MTEKPLAFSYIRMSTTAQLAGDSLRRQTELSKMFAAEHDLHLVEHLEDIGVSAFKGKNAKEGALGQFLASVANGDIPEGSFLLIESFDRLSRQEILSSLKLFIDILDAGITIATLLDGQIFRPGKTDFQQLLVTITLMSRANEESATKSKRLGEAWRQKRANAVEKKLTKKCPAWLQLSDDRSHFIPIPEKVAIIQRIFDSAVDGQGSYAIAHLLNREGVAPIGSNRHWIKSYVSKILTSRTVLGEFQPHRKQDGRRVPEGNPIEGYFPRIISDEQFYRVQSSRKSRKQEGRGRLGVGTPNLFKNIAKCKYCSMPMHLVNKGSGPKGGKYLRCSGAMNGSGCSGTSWRYADFETSFLFFCSEVNLKEILEASGRREAALGLQEKVRQMEELREAKVQERERIFALTRQDGVAIDYISGKLNAVTAELRDIQNEITELSQSMTLAESDNPLTDEDIEDSLRLLIEAPEVERAKVRARVHARLLRIIDSLYLAPAGDSPKKEVILKQLVEGFDAERVSQFVATANDLFLDAKKFQVSFVGGMHRLVVVDPNEPKKFHSRVEVLDGKKTFESHRHSPVEAWSDWTDEEIDKFINLTESDGR
jgi:DNA invertase Pin-like site-specific DNA recombinase